MIISHRNKQYLFVSGISILAVLIGGETLMAVMTEDPYRYIQVFGMCLLIISGIWQFRISRRAEEAETSEEDADAT